MLPKVTEQPSFTGAASVFPYSVGLEAQYQYKTYSGEMASMAYRQGTTLHVPRNTTPLGKVDWRTSHKPVAINCTFEPRSDEQQECALQSLALLVAGQDHILKAPTGWGKSVIGGYIAAKLGQPTMIIVTKTDLMNGWYDALTQALGISPNLIGKVQQNECIWKGKQFVLGMIHSLVIPNRYPEEMYHYFGMLLVDEVDQVAADTFVNTCWKFPAKYRLGMTATTQRGDGRWDVVRAHMGDVKVEGKLVPMPPKVLKKETGWRIPAHTHFEPGRMMGVAKALSKDALRNREIVLFVEQAWKAGRRIVVMSDLTDHLTELFGLLTMAGIPGEDIGYYVGGMKQIELDNNKVKHVVLATYKMCDRGTNVPIWDTLVMATPRSQVKQIIGRVMRYVPGKKEPVILDLVDANSIFHNFYLSRLKQYFSVQAKVVEL